MFAQLEDQGITVEVKKKRKKDKLFYKKTLSSTVNINWESEITAYDEECNRQEKKFFEKHFFITESGTDKLTKEENEILNLYLNGVSCETIAEQSGVEIEVVTGLLEIIRAKLSLND